MAKFDDIVPPSRRARDEGALTSTNDSPRYASRPRGRFPWTTIIVVVIIIAACAAALIYFSGAKIEITPMTNSVAADGSYMASGSSTAGALSYTVISAQKVASQSLAMTGTKAVSSSALGTITIYNTQNAAQKLITNTRFATESGLVFHIHAPVSIPPAQGTTPGQVTATVYADQPGSQYNTGPSSFTVPGLSGSPQFAQVYAKSTTAFSGGASGNEPVVDPAAETAARAALVTALDPELATALTAQVPAGYVLLSGAATTSYQTLPSEAGTGNNATIKEQGTITAVVFPSAELGQSIEEHAAGTTTPALPATVANPSAIAFKGTVPVGSPSGGSFTFTLTGTAQLVAVIDPARIAAAVAGASRDEARTALKSFPEVSQAVLVLRPFWKSSFPEDPASITVTVDAPSQN